MNWKRFALTFVVVLVLSTLSGFLIHGMLLNADYAQFPSLLRTQEDANAHFPFMLLQFVAFSLAFAWIYAHGLEDRPWLGQGIRFGLAVWLLTSVSTFLTYYAIQRWPGALVGKQIRIRTGRETSPRTGGGCALSEISSRFCGPPPATEQATEL